MFKLICSGFIAADVELRYTDEGKARLSFSLPINNRRKSGDDWIEHTDWVRVRTGNESMKDKLTKGVRVQVIGNLQTSEYEAKDGSGKRFSLDVWADSIEVLNKAPEPVSSTREPIAVGGRSSPVAPVDDGTEELPF